MELLARQGNNGPDVDDAMFSKRHIGPLACASCEKNIVNMYGQKVDHHVWNKLPFRDPNERIARYGQGFSKILSHMRPSDLISPGHSPTRNTMGGSYALQQSVDDTNIVRPSYGHNPEVSQHYVETHSMDGHNPAFRQGKTVHTDRRSSTIAGNEGFGGATTNPGTSDHEYPRVIHEVGKNQEILPKLSGHRKN